MRQIHRFVITSLMLGLFLGVTIAVIANLFVMAISQAEHLRAEHMDSHNLSGQIFSFMPFLWLFGSFLAVRLLAHFARIERWHGPADAIFAAHSMKNEMSVKHGIASALAALISLSGGASLGQYGPIVHMGALLGSLFRRFDVKSLFSNDIFIGCGVAAAVSAGFQAPLAGIIFAHEAVLRHFSVRAIAPISISSITAAFVGEWLFGGEHLLKISIIPSNLMMQIPGLLIGGVMFGLLAIAIMKGHFFLLGWQAKTQVKQQTIWIAAIAMLSVLGGFFPEILGLGMNTLSAMIAGEFVLKGLVILLAAKIVALLLSSCFGFVGGFVSPALFIGAAAGGAMALIFGAMGIDASISVMMVAGMAALSATIVGAPLAMVMLVFELTESYDYAVAAMLSVVVSSVISHISFGHSLFDEQLRRRQIDISKGRVFLALKETSVNDIMHQDYLRITPQMSVKQAIDSLHTHQQTEAYCVDEKGIYHGKLFLSTLIGLPKKQPAIQAVSIDEIQISSETSLQEAIEIAADFVGETIAIIASDSPKIIGVVSEGDLMTAFLEQQSKAHGIEHG